MTETEAIGSSAPRAYSWDPPVVDVSQIPGEPPPGPLPRQIFDPIPSGPAPPVGWDPDTHVWQPLIGTAFVTRALAPVGGTSTTSGTFVDIAGLVDTTPIGGATSADLIVIAQVTMNHTAINTNSSVGIALDGATPVNAAGGVVAVATTGLFTLTTVAYFPGVTPGAHTVRTQWLTAGGTLFATASRYIMLVIELRH